jgi:hypothetical protein
MLLGLELTQFHRTALIAMINFLADACLQHCEVDDIGIDKLEIELSVGGLVTGVSYTL